MTATESLSPLFLRKQLRVHFGAWFVLGVVVVRLLWHLFEPIGMAGDETYYWLWGQYPDWGYYSKPPLIAWIYGSLTALFGQSVFVYKAFSTLLGAGSLWFFYRTLAVATGNESLARWGLVSLALLPAHLLISSVMTVDSPLTFAWTGGMYFTAKLLTGEKASPGDFFALWLLLSLGHLAKQMMLFQPVLIVLLFAFYKRELLREIGLWIALLGSLVALLHALWWNSQHDWITVEHTAHHFGGNGFSLLKALGRLGEFWGALAGLFSPVLFVLLFPALKWAWTRRHEPMVGYFFLFGAPAMAVISLMTLRQRVNPNWPAVYLFGCLGILLLWGFSTDLRRRWLKRGIIVAGSFSLAVMIALLLLEPLARPLAQIGILPQRRGWQGYPQLVSKVLALPKVPDQLMFVGHRFTASQFAFRHDYPKRVHLWDESQETITNQFDFFAQPETGKPLLVVVEENNETNSYLPPKLAERLEGIEYLAEFPMHPARSYPLFRIYRAEKLKSWPSQGELSGQP